MKKGEQHSEYVYSLGSFPVIVPRWYNRDRSIGKSSNKDRFELKKWSDIASHEDLVNPPVVLTPGRHFKVMQLAIRRGKRISFEQGLEITAAHGGVLVGVHGLTLAYTLGEAFMFRGGTEKGKGYVSFNKKEEFPLDNSHRKVPFLFAFPEGDFQWCRCDVNDFWDDESIILCFCEEEKV